MAYIVCTPELNCHFAMISFSISDFFLLISSLFLSFICRRFDWFKHGVTAWVCAHSVRVKELLLDFPL